MENTRGKIGVDYYSGAVSSMRDDITQLIGLVERVAKECRGLLDRMEQV
jgi:hypothetical protein